MHKYVGGERVFGPHVKHGVSNEILRRRWRIGHSKRIGQTGAIGTCSMFAEYKSFQVPSIYFYVGYVVQNTLSGVYIHRIFPNPKDNTYLADTVYVVYVRVCENAYCL